MKGITPLVAAVLIIAFTIAVATIISIWLTGFTRLQTARVAAATQCGITRLEVRCSDFTTDQCTLIVTNHGPEEVNVTGVSLLCNGVNATSANINLGVMSVGDVRAGTVSWTPSGTCESKSNLDLTVVATCDDSVVVGNCEGIGC